MKFSAGTLIRHPRKAFRALFKPAPDEQPAGPTRKRNQITRTLSHRLAEIEQCGYKKVLVFADRSCQELIKPDWIWASNRFEDIKAGASRLEDVDVSKFDCILIATEDSQTAYRQCITALKRKAITKPVLWTGTFEFCGGNLLVPEEATEADIYLFQHFEAFFQVKDELLVRIRLYDNESFHEQLFILSPNHTLKLRLSDYLPNRQGPSQVEIFCEHPVLTRGRHDRWRLFADVFTGDSMTSLHGSHNFNKAQNQLSRINTELFGAGELTLLLPEHPPNVTGTLLTAPNEKAASASNILEQRYPKQGPMEPYISYCIHSNAAGFWFYREKNPGNNHESLIANHTVSNFIEDVDGSLDDEATLLLESVQKNNYSVNPYALPVCSPDSPFEFGFSVGSTNPVIYDYAFYVFDQNGSRIDSFKYHFEHSGVYYTSDILQERPEKIREKANLIIVAPDYLAARSNPRKEQCQPDLFVRHRKTNDKDLTEYQSCWRNLGVSIPEFPHWLHPSRGIIGRTNVVGRVLHNGDFQTILSVANASGYLKYETEAEVLIRFFNPQGEEQQVRLVLPPFGSRLLQLENLIENPDTFLKEGYGTFLVQSSDADTNCQVITVWREQAVSLQHLWGY